MFTTGHSSDGSSIGGKYHTGFRTFIRSSSQQAQSGQAVFLHLRKKRWAPTMLECTGKNSLVAGKFTTTHLPSLVIRVSQEFGVDGKRILEEADCNAHALHDDLIISYNLGLRIIETAIQLCNQNALGLMVGLRQNLATLGVLGFAMMSCATFGDALKTYIKYHPITFSFLELSYRITDGVFILQADPQGISYDMFSFFVDLLFAGFLSISGLLLGKAVTPRAVYLSYPVADKYDLYKKTFSGAIYEHSHVNRYILDESWLKHPLVHTDAVSEKLGTKLCEDLLVMLGCKENIVDSIRLLLIRSSKELPNMDEVAAQLGYSPRNLRNHLNKHNTSFRKITEEVLTTKAIEYLSYSHLSIDEIADLIGFSETTNFCRAFKKWTNETPKRYREGLSGKKIWSVFPDSIRIGGSKPPRYL